MASESVEAGQSEAGQVSAGDVAGGSGAAARDDTSLLERVRAWIEADPEPSTRAELEALMARRQLGELRERFAEPLRFGTAGLRGRVGAGPGRINRAVVIRVTRALALNLLGRSPEARSLPVVVGHDARLSSAGLAADVVSVLVAAGVPVRWFASPVPTPLVAYAARRLAAQAAVVITASHNPPDDNGYKLYGDAGIQIVPPVDIAIAALMEQVGPAAAVPGIREAGGVGHAAPESPRPAPQAGRGGPARGGQVRGGQVRGGQVRGGQGDASLGGGRYGEGAQGDGGQGEGGQGEGGEGDASLGGGGYGEGAQVVSPELGESYLAAIAALVPPGPARRDLGIVYTALHGVGGVWVERALGRAGFERVSSVAQQMQPDGHFPTLRFPNPEEPGALDLALEQARTTGADLVLANDPDADRLAVCVPTPAGSWQVLTGNQIGVLLADFLLAAAPARPTPLVVSTLVSSPMLDAVAAAHGARCERTLTGFKWIWTAARALEAGGGLRYVFGYEEALGFGAGGLVRDKDGISAALLFAELAARCRAEGTTVRERLARLYAQHGVWASAQRSVALPGVEGRQRIERAVERLAEAPPSVVDGRAVHSFTDYGKGAEARPPWLPATPLLALALAGGARVLVRPSGTEPKLKVYVDLRGAASEANVWGAFEERYAEALRLAAVVVQGLGLETAPAVAG